MISSILGILWQALAYLNRLHDSYNSADMVRAKHAQANQDLKDAWVNSERVLADPNATAQQHRESLDRIRLAGS